MAFHLARMLDLASEIRASNLPNEEINRRVKEALEAVFGKVTLVMLHHLDEESASDPEKFENLLRRTYGAAAEVILQSIYERLAPQVH